MAGNITAVDRFQRRHPVLGFPIAVIYKYGDDQGNYLAALLTYYALIAIFPILLILSSVLGFFLEGDPQRQEQVLETALSQFPIIGDQLGRPDGLSGNTTAVVVGALTATFGAMGLGHAGQHVMYTAWSVPRNSRPNPFLLRFRAILLVTFSGTVIIVLTVGSTVVSNYRVFGIEFMREVQLLIRLGSVVLIALIFAFLFWWASGRIGTWRTMLPGAFVVAVLWQFVQFLGTLYAERVIARASAVNATFALILGLIGLLFIASFMAVLGVEVNVVRARRLYPRALLTPFTDNVELTSADQRAYRYYAKAQRHKGFEKIRVDFDPKDPPDTFVDDR